MEKSRKLGLMAIVFLFTLILLIPTVSAAPGIYGTTYGPSRVIRDQWFRATVNIRNYGSTPAYLTSIRLNVPYGFHVRNTNPVYVGTLYPGSGRTLYFDVKAPPYATSGYISSFATYSDNQWGYGTSLVTGLSGFYIQVTQGIRITVVLSSIMSIRQGYVTLYDTYGRYVASGGSYNTFGSSTLSINVYVPSTGTYTGAAAAILVNGMNALGRKTFSVYADTTVSIFCWPI